MKYVFQQDNSFILITHGIIHYNLPLIQFMWKMIPLNWVADICYLVYLCIIYSVESEALIILVALTNDLRQGPTTPCRITNYQICLLWLELSFCVYYHNWWLNHEIFIGECDDVIMIFPKYFAWSTLTTLSRDIFGNYNTVLWLSILITYMLKRDYNIALYIAKSELYFPNQNILHIIGLEHLITLKLSNFRLMVIW